MHSDHVQPWSLATTRVRKHRISTEELEAKLGIHDIRHYVHSRALRYLGHVFRIHGRRPWFRVFKPHLFKRVVTIPGRVLFGNWGYDSVTNEIRIPKLNSVSDMLRATDHASISFCYHSATANLPAKLPSSFWRPTVQCSSPHPLLPLYSSVDSSTAHGTAPGAMPPLVVTMIGATKFIPRSGHRSLYLPVFVFSADPVPAFGLKVDWLQVLVPEWRTAFGSTMLTSKATLLLQL